MGATNQDFHSTYILFLVERAGKYFCVIVYVHQSGKVEPFLQFIASVIALLGFSLVRLIASAAVVKQGGQRGWRVD